MRQLKELLQILLDEVERNGVDFGLCSVVVFSERFNPIEVNILNKWIKSKMQPFEIWLFPKGETAPRIEFLKNEIEKL